MEGGECPSHAAAHRVAAQNETLHAKPLGGLSHHIRLLFRRRGIGRWCPRQAMAGQVERDDPVPVTQSLHPRLPRMERGGKAVNQHQDGPLGIALVAIVDTDPFG